MRYLYLDDIRTPLEPNWDVVRSYDEFKAYLVKNFTQGGEIAPVPVEVDLFVSFDHDLADEHYTPKHLWDDYSASTKHQDEREYKEKTGLDCAKLLAEYNLIPEKCNCHSMNPVGASNIKGYLEGWFRFTGYGRECTLSTNSIKFKSN